MAKQVEWTQIAEEDKDAILLYWNERNQSTAYSFKLNNRIKEVIALVAIQPKIGRKTDDGKARIKVILGYKLIYEELPDKILILRFWDSRQDPEKLKY